MEHKFQLSKPEEEEALCMDIVEIMAYEDQFELKKESCFKIREIVKKLYHISANYESIVALMLLIYAKN